MDALARISPEEDVAAAVAFIESLERGYIINGEAQAVAKATAGSGEDSGQTASDSSTIQSLKRVRPRRKRKNKPGYSTEQGRRKKAELLALRSEVVGLEEWLKRLKGAKADTLASGPVDSTEMLYRFQGKGRHQAVAKAMSEFEKRRRAENINSKLKSVVDHHMKVSEDLYSTFQKLNALRELESELQSPTREPVLRVDDTPMIVDQLGKQVARLYLDCDSVFPKEHLPSFGCSMQPAVHHYRGRIMEIVARAPVSCSMKQASDILWKELSTVRRYPDKVYRYMTERGPNAVAKGFDMTLRSERTATAVNGLQFMKRFEEKERIVQVRAYKLLLPTEGVHLRGHAWTIISKSAADPLHKCDVQFYLQLFVENQSGISARIEDMDFIQHVGLETWSSMMRTYTMWLQDMVVEKAGEIAF